MSWQKITCDEREALFIRSDVLEEPAVPHGRLTVLSGKTDMYGVYGEPEIRTEWGLRDGTRVLLDVRWPNPDGGRDVAPCEHYEWAAAVSVEAEQ